jgi:hypothetical protein
MPALVAGIHVLTTEKTWMAGTSPAMTETALAKFPLRKGFGYDIGRKALSRLLLRVLVQNR